MLVPLLNLSVLKKMLRRKKLILSFQWKNYVQFCVTPEKHLILWLNVAQSREKLVVVRKTAGGIWLWLSEIVSPMALNGIAIPVEGLQTKNWIRWLIHFRTKSIRDGSYFAKSRLSLSQLLLLVYLWSVGTPQNAQATIAGVSYRSVLQWNAFIRDICSTWLLRNPVRLGGPGIVVQIDESVMAKQKYHRGHLPSGSSRWVFGMVDTQSRLAHVQMVEDRSAKTLIPIIQKHCAPGF